MPFKEAGDCQKLKLLILADILRHDTDEAHPLTVYELSEMLAAQGVNANRKTISEDIAILEMYGMDILSINRGRAKGYYLASREFELTELKLLADAVSSARFITEKKSRQLIKKLEGLADKFSAGELRRRVFIANRVKSANEMIYLNVDAIQRAINEKCMIKFRYFFYNSSKEKVYKGERICSPYALTWSDGNYYLVAYYEGHPESLTNFRVDRMERVSLLAEKAEKMPEGFDLSGYMSTSFSMFSGKDMDIKIKFDEGLANSVLDKFGPDTIMIPSEDGTFTINVKIKPGFTFYGWLFQFGTGAEIISPPEIREAFCQMTEDVRKKYR